MDDQLEPILAEDEENFKPLKTVFPFRWENLIELTGQILPINNYNVPVIRFFWWKWVTDDRNCRRNLSDESLYLVSTFVYR